MKPGRPLRLQINVEITDRTSVAPLQAYAFTRLGLLLGSAPVEKNTAAIEVPSELDGRMLEVIVGPRVEPGMPIPTASNLKGAGGFAQSVRLLGESPVVTIRVPGVIFPPWCFCYVRGRLIKRVTLPDGTTAEWPVCHARVHVCEVDAIPIIIWRLPDTVIARLRDDLLERLRIVPWPPLPPVPPHPDPGPRSPAGAMPMAAIAAQTTPRAGGNDPAARAPSATLDATAARTAALAATQTVQQARSLLANLANLIVIHLCDFEYLWRWFRVNCLATVDVDHQGRFGTFIVRDCGDPPDVYFWVEQFRDGAWVTVYRPGIGCGTHWDYACGKEIVVNVPGAAACEDPPYDLPPGVTLFVAPWAIASTPIWGIPAGAPPAPFGWVRPDGLVDYTDTEPSTSLGALYNAPFAGTLNFVHDDSYFIPSSGIKYYRYAYRRHSAAPNSGADDPSWTPISAALARGYRMEYSDRLPSYEAWPAGPITLGTHSGLFEFKPQAPPPRAGDPATVIAREWTSGNLSEAAASWDTTGPAPALSPTVTVDQAGDFDVKLEVFDPAGNQVLPGNSTFVFIARNADYATTRLASAAELAGGAYVLRVHVDNNGVAASLPQPSISGVAASDDCGFLRYQPGDAVHVQYLATHVNQHAVFRFGITRGSHGVPATATLPPYVEVAAASAPTATAPYVKASGWYQRDFTPAELVGTCVNAAFAASLGVYSKATNGNRRQVFDRGLLIAFALAEQSAAP